MSYQTNSSVSMFYFSVLFCFVLFFCFLSRVIFVFLLSLGMVMYANEVETKVKEKNTCDKKLTTTYMWSVTVQFSQTGYYVQGSYLQVYTFS